MRRNGTDVVCSVLDVFTTNVDTTWEPLYVPVTERIPTSGRESMDHSPIGLTWALARGAKRRSFRAPQPLSDVVRRPLPTWLLHDRTFSHLLNSSFEGWLLHRSPGGQGILEFTDLVYQLGMDFLRGHLVEAVTPRHRLEVTLKMLQHIDFHADFRISLDLMQKWCTIYPDLSNKIRIVVDLDRPGTCSSDLESRNNLRQHARDLAAQIASEVQTDTGATDTGSFLTHKRTGQLLHRLKLLRPQHKMPGCERLWDGEAYTDDPERMAGIIKAAALERQGQDNSDADAGQDLLDSWPMDLSRCRTTVHNVEIIELILGTGSNKQPGPDGVAAEFYKRFAKPLAPVFQECWDELLNAQYSAPDHLGVRKWLVTPKIPKPTTTDKLRDLELLNVSRKILARIANRVLDEQFKTQLHPSQQAFFSSGDITRNLVMLQSTFRDYHQVLKQLLLLLSLDCSKAYNHTAWRWLRRCLAASKLPLPLQRLILSFLPGMVYLVFQGAVTEGIQYGSGLAIGCPLSCYLFLLIVDPLLHQLSATPGVVGLSAFADDWTVCCDGLATLYRIRPLLQNFEAASGQRVNIPKSGIIPTRTLTQAEALCCRIFWGQIQILLRARILGLWFGPEVTIEDQYRGPLDKFAQALAEFSSIRVRLSFAMRIAVVNTFFVSLFSFVNRLFFMPEAILQSIETRILSFLSRVPFARLGIFAHLKRLYGINAETRDLRLSNIAAVLSTYVCNPRNTSHLHNSLLRIFNAHPGHRFGRPAAHLEHPACSWQCAREYFLERVGDCPSAVYAKTLPCAFRRAHLDVQLPPIQSILYKVLQKHETPMWRTYLCNRIQDKGWNSASFRQGFDKCPRAATQAQRWTLFRIHLNGLMTSTRVHAALPAVAVIPCPLCGGPDSAEHLLHCPATQAAFNIAAGALPPHIHQTASWSQLFFQSPVHDDVFTFTIALFSAAWSCRGAVLRGYECRGEPAEARRANRAACIARALDHPGLLSGNSASSAERRAARIQPPPQRPSHAALSRTDGGFGLNSWDAQLTGVWGAAWWAAGVDPSTPATATAAGICPDPSSNNIAEYFGFREALRRALRILPPSLVFELDSMLIVMQMSGRWGCHRRHLRDLLAECYDLGEQLTQAGCAWSIRHIYREFNQVADRLAGDCLRNAANARASPSW